MTNRAAALKRKSAIELKKRHSAKDEEDSQRSTSDGNPDLTKIMYDKKKQIDHILNIESQS